MSKVTLYTGDTAYKLFEMNEQFAASKEDYHEYTYVVKAPQESIREVYEGNEIAYIEVFNLKGVTFKERKKVKSK